MIDSINKSKIIVAMSGGIDSTACVTILQNLGYEVIGAHFLMTDQTTSILSNQPNGSATPLQKASAGAKLFEIDLKIVDCKKEFKENIIDYFVSTYLKGSTPNPCIRCNRLIKFKTLFSLAKENDAEKICTGHYARILKKEDGFYGLFTAIELQKDQSYYLYSLKQEELKNILFPLGERKKEELRALLKNRGFEFFGQSESQDICFIPSEHWEFIESQTTVIPQFGNFVSIQGKKLGTHKGIHRYTIGQRRGLGIGYTEPLYVTHIDIQSNTIVLGTKNDLKKNGLVVTQVNWLCKSSLEKLLNEGKLEVTAKLRYRHYGVKCLLRPITRDFVNYTESSNDIPNFHDITSPDCYPDIQITFLDDNWSTVSPGQSAVFYGPILDKNGMREVLGGGIISHGA